MTGMAARDDVDVVVELVGGSDGPALTLARNAIQHGKALVTANKAMIAHHGMALAGAAEARAWRCVSRRRWRAASR
jgi:homoserine dehydrogenase